LQSRSLLVFLVMILGSSDKVQEDVSSIPKEKLALVARWR
jgi:hypothetical protein